MRPAVVERLTDRLYGRPIIRNVLRGELVEQMVLDALGEGWREAPDYEVWDVQSADGAIKIQIKQSAARQSWSEKQAPATLPRFSIEPSRAWTEADGRAAEAARHAALYIFAWHPRID